MKNIFKLISTQPLSIWCNKINRNLGKKIFKTTLSDSFLMEKRFKSYKSKKELIHLKKFERVFQKTALKELKKSHLNVSHNWISYKYCFFIFGYKIKTTQRTNFLSSYFLLRNPFYINFRPIFLSFIYSTIKLPYFFYTKNLKKKKVNTHKLNFFGNQKNYPQIRVGFENPYLWRKALLNLILRSRVLPHLENRLSNKFQVIENKKLHSQKSLYTGLGYSYLGLVNLDSYKLRLTTKNNTPLKLNKTLERFWKLKDQEYIFQKYKTSKFLSTQVSFVDHSSQILTTYLDIPRNDSFSVRTYFSQNINIKNFKQNFHNDLKRQKENFFELNKKENFIAYPAFCDFHSKLNLLEKDIHQKNKILSFLKT